MTTLVSSWRHALRFFLSGIHKVYIASAFLWRHALRFFLSGIRKVYIASAFLWRHALRFFLSGMAVGCAALVPGVSAATLALLTGVYFRILDCSTSFNLPLLHYVLKGKLRQAAVHIQIAFLMPFVLGVVTAVGLFAHLFKKGLENYPEIFRSFFFGLLLGTAWWMLRHLFYLMQAQSTHKRFLVYVWAGIGLSTSLGMGLLASPLSQVVEPAYGWITLCAIVATCASFLPGISGSFVLLLLGAYPTFLNALTTLRMDYLLAMAVGGLIGLISFIRLLYTLQKRYTLHLWAFLSGLMVGSTPQLWPWQDQEERRWLSPLAYETYFPQTPSWIFLSLVMVLAIVLILAFAPRRQSKPMA